MKYISILRGINVSGQKKIIMADLKALYEAQGFENVLTYIQSGNVIFDADEINQQESIARIEKAIEAEYGFQVPVDLRTHQALGEIIENCPFEEAQNEENGAKVMLIFLKTLPSQKSINLLLEAIKAPEKLTIKGTEVYLFCSNGYGRTKLNNNFIEKQLGVSATTRNWRSVKKIYDISNT